MLLSRSESPDYKASFSENRYRVEVSAGENGLETRFGARNPTLPSNFYLEIDTQKAVGDPDSWYGIMFHYVYEDNAGSFYSFRIRNSGTFDFVRVDREKPEVLLSKPIRLESGEINKIAILARDANYKFYVNGIEVGEYSNPVLKSGGIGVNTFHNHNEHTIVEYDNLELFTPP